MMKIMLRKRSAQLLLLGALTLAIGGVTFSTPASGAPVVSGPMANSAVKGLIRADLIRAEIVTFAGDQVGDNWVYRGVVRKVRGRQQSATAPSYESSSRQPLRSTSIIGRSRRNACGRACVRR
jgi:hypothetical protein